ncbi:hypothetical protein PENTCL1PPCAC_6089, partial [Pristionchus entomophagus]
MNKQIRHPCGDRRLQKCDQWANMCPSKNPNCEYYIWRYVPKEKHYCEGDEKKTFHLHDFNVWNKGEE